MRRIMNGDSSIVLKSLIESCGWGNSMKDFTSLFGIVSASHLTYLLAKSGVSSSNSSFLSSSDRNKTELLGELFSVGNSGKSSGSINLSETLPNEASFVEELFLESVQRINELQFPLEVCLYIDDFYLFIFIYIYFIYLLKKHNYLIITIIQKYLNY